MFELTSFCSNFLCNNAVFFLPANKEYDVDFTISTKCLPFFKTNEWLLQKLESIDV